MEAFILSRPLFPPCSLCGPDVNKKVNLFKRTFYLSPVDVNLESV